MSVLVAKRIQRSEIEAAEAWVEMFVRIEPIRSKILRSLALARAYLEAEKLAQWIVEYEAGTRGPTLGFIKERAGAFLAEHEPVAE